MHLFTLVDGQRYDPSMQQSSMVEHGVWNSIFGFLFEAFASY
jgi:hypothetical protein